MDNQMLPIEQQLIAIKRNFGKIIKAVFNFPVVGLIISLALLVLGHYLKEKGTQTTMQGDDTNLAFWEVNLFLFRYNFPDFSSYFNPGID